MRLLGTLSVALVSATTTLALVAAGAGTSAHLVDAPAVAARAHGHGHAHGPDRGHDRGLVRVAGAVDHKLHLDLAALQAFTQHSVTASYTSAGAPVSATFTGPLLIDVVDAAAPRFDADVKNDALAFAVRATGTDGYRAVVAWGEIDPGFEAKQVLVALTQDGVALARPRLVVPGDAKGGRYVSDLDALRVRDLGGH